MATATSEPQVMDDGIVYEGDRYAIYTVDGFADRHEIARTSKDGIGTCLVQLRFPTEAGETAQITEHDRVGILDRLERKWVVNPWARGR